jgi:transposase
MKQNLDCSKLQRILDKSKVSIPNFKLIQPQIDGRFFDIKQTKEQFDVFIKLRLFKDKTVNIPYKKHKQFLKWEENGKLLNSLRISKDSISVSFEIPDIDKRILGEIVGADQGISTCLTLSDNQTTRKNNHGYDLKDIINILCRKKKGSISFRKAQQHRENYINWSLNQLNFSNVKQINLEKLFQVGKGTNQGTFLSSFTYPLIKKKLLSLSESEGFTIKETSNEFRSQRCSDCGWTQKSNRNKKFVKCKHCGFATDADFNASLNLKEDGLPPVPKWVRLKKLNIKGFFWNLSGIMSLNGENIVPYVQKTNN